MLLYYYLSIKVSKLSMKTVQNVIKSPSTLWNLRSCVLVHHAPIGLPGVVARKATITQQPTTRIVSCQNKH